MRISENYVDEEGHPTKEGSYLAKGVLGDAEPREINVYKHPTLGFSCFVRDCWGEGRNFQVTTIIAGVEFIERVGDLRSAQDEN